MSGIVASSKKHQKAQKSAFIDDAAELSDEENIEVSEDEAEEEEEANEEDRRFIAAEDEVEESAGAVEGDAIEVEDLEEKTMPRNVSGSADRSSRSFDDDSIHRRLENEEQSKWEKKMIAKLKERYGDAVEREDDIVDEAEDDFEYEEEFDFQAVLPKVTDPKLFMLKCDPGKENEAILALLNKYKFREEKGDPIFMYSAFTTPAAKGYVYVEADREVYVKDAVKDIRPLKAWSVKLVPLREMAQTMTINDHVSQIKPGEWVRIKRGLYKGDLGLVTECKDQSTKITVKLMPRIDLAAFEESKEKHDTTPKKQTLKRKRVLRPPQRLFNANDFEGAANRRNIDNSYFFQGKTYRNGFLYQTFHISGLILDVHPTAPEIERFKVDDEDADLRDDAIRSAAVSTDAMNLSTNGERMKLQIGDRVIVVEGAFAHGRQQKGQWQNLVGRIKQINRSTVLITPDPGQIVSEAFEVTVHEVKKYFSSGDVIQVVRGEHRGESGLVTFFNEHDNTITFFSIITDKPITVSIYDAMIGTGSSSTFDTLGQYQLHDLVSLSNDDVVLIVKVLRSSAEVVNLRNLSSTVALKDIKRKMPPRTQSTTDGHGNIIRVANMVKIQRGDHQGLDAVIKSIYRNSLFLYHKDISQNNGILVLPASQCVLVGENAFTKFGSMQQPVMSAESRNMAMLAGGFSPAPILAVKVPKKNEFDAPSGRVSAAGRGGGGGAPRFAGRNGIHHRDVGKSALIKLGSYKGWSGRIVDANESNVRVELNAISRTVSMPRHAVKISEDKNGKGALQPTTRAHGAGNLLGSQTPSLLGAATPRFELLGQTPGHGYEIGKTPHIGRTPASAAMTPSSSTMTPSRDVWNPDTPHPQPPAAFDVDADNEDEEKNALHSMLPPTPIPSSLPTPHTLHDDMDVEKTLRTPLPNTPLPATPATPMDATHETDVNEEQHSEDAVEYGAGCRVRVDGKLGTVFALLADGQYRVVYDSGGDAAVPVDHLQPENEGLLKDNVVFVIRGDRRGVLCKVLNTNQDDVVVSIGDDIEVMERKNLARSNQRI